MATWNLVDSRASGGSAVLQIGIVDASTAVAVNFSNEILRSTDGGDTWAIVHVLPTAANSTVLVGNGAVVITGGSPFIFTSLDDGATWADTTPVGYNSGGSATFLPGVGVFIINDGNANCFRVSADGITWTQVTCASIGLPGINIDTAEIFAAEGAGVAVLSFISFNPNVHLVQISSPDGFSWTLRNSYALAATPSFPTRGPVLWNGDIFYTNALDQNGVTIGFTSSDGISWVLLSGPPGHPPYVDASADFNFSIYTSSFSTNQIGISDDDAGLWSSDTVPDCSFVDLLAQPSELFAFGEAIVVFNGATWTTELGPLATGFIERIFSNFGLTLACGLDDAGNGAIWKRIVAPPPPPASSGDCDPNFNSVTLLLQMDAGALVELTGLPVISVVGGGTPISNDAFYNPGTPTQRQNYIEASGAPGLFIFAGDFTHEAYIYVDHYTHPFTAFLGGFPLFPVAGFWHSMQFADNGDFNFGFSGGPYVVASGLAPGAWYHVAISRTAGLVQMFINGVEVNSVPAAATIGVLSGGNSVVLIGAGNSFLTGPGNSGDFNGFIASVRITNGVGRYTADFTPPGFPFGVACPTVVLAPFVIGMSLANATTAILAGLLIVGTVTSQPSLTVPVGNIIAQDPAGGTPVVPGSAVNLVRSSGFVLAPDAEDIPASAANALILAAGLSVGEAGTGASTTIPYGNVIAQDPAPLTHLLPGSPISYVISVPSGDFDVRKTVISQYANSPTLLRLVDNMAGYLKEGVTLAQFYQFVWNVDTAVGFGLDIWGRIVGVSRLLQIPGDDPIVGFDNVSIPKDWTPMSQGRWAVENEITTAYELPDDAYRVLILTKALANIVTTTAPALNKLLQNMFPGRGRCFVRDLGGMAMQFVFNFSLTTVEFAILTQSGVLPHPAGVFYSVVVIPGGLFGFQGYTGAKPFNFGVFNSRPP